MSYLNMLTDCFFHEIFLFLFDLEKGNDETGTSAVYIWSECSNVNYSVYLGRKLSRVSVWMNGVTLLQK